MVFPILWTAQVGHTLAYPPQVQVVPAMLGADGAGLSWLVQYATRLDRGDQVFLVDAGMCKAWGLHANPLHRNNGPRLDVHGMERGPAGPWITYRHRAGRVHVGFLPWIAERPKDHPLFGDLIPDGGWLGQDGAEVIAKMILNRLQRWQSLMGNAYHGIPGVAGTDLIRRQYDHGSSWAPRWHDAAPILAHEPEISRWVSRHNPGSAAPRTSLDTNRAYLAAMGTALYAPGGLRPDERTEFDPNMAGWWLISADPWPHPDKLPDPLQRTHQMGALQVWVTTPTLQLWDQFTRADVVTGYTIHGAYLARGTRLLRHWADRLNNAWEITRLTETSDSPLATTLQECYRQTFGLLNHEAARIYRPDWHYTTVGQAKATLLRKAWKHGVAHNEWPVAIRTDALVYSPDVAYHRAIDCVAAHPRLCPTLHVDNQDYALGTFKTKRSAA